MHKIEQALPTALRTFMLTARLALSAHLAPPVTVASLAQARHLQQLIAATRDHQGLVIGYDAAYSRTSQTYRLEP